MLLTNVVGTFAVTKAFLPLLKQGKMKTILNISSDAGCLAQNASFIHDDKPSDAGMALSYRTSKVAVNMGELPSHVLTRTCTLLFCRIGQYEASNHFNQSNAKLFVAVHALAPLGCKAALSSAMCPSCMPCCTLTSVSPPLDWMQKQLCLQTT